MIILGKDGKEYPDIKACLKADEAYDRKIAEEAAQKEEKRKAEEIALAERKVEISRRKKELSQAIEQAKDKVKIASVDYNQAKEKAERIISAAREEAQKLLKDASDKLKTANEEKVNAISNFNKEFGPFTTVLTGDDALQEYKKVKDSIDKQFNRFLNVFNWWI